MSRTSQGCSDAERAQLAKDLAHYASISRSKFRQALHLSHEQAAGMAMGAAGHVSGPRPAVRPPSVETNPPTPTAPPAPHPGPVAPTPTPSSARKPKPPKPTSPYQMGISEETINEAINKIPKEWGGGIDNKKAVGWRWADPSNSSGNNIR